MRFALAIFAILALICSFICANPILDANDFTKFVREIKHARLYITEGVATETKQDYKLPVVHLWGTNYYEQGYAQGSILWAEIDAFNRMVPVWYELSDLARSATNAALPQDIQEIMKNAQGADISKAMHIALNWVYEHQFPYMTSSLVDFDLEVKGIAQGYCDGMVKAGKACKYQEALMQIRATQVFPELVRMGCTITASWGIANAIKTGTTQDAYRLIQDKMVESISSTLSAIKKNTSQQSFESVGIKPGQDLIQSRLLDFGPCPITSHHTLLVRHFDHFTTLSTPSTAFYSLSFPGHVTVITSGSTSMTQSQKVYLDFIDRGDGSSHVPTSFSSFSPSSKTPDQPNCPNMDSSTSSTDSIAFQRDQRAKFISRFVPDDERAGTHADLLTANFRSIPAEERTRRFANALDDKTTPTLLSIEERDAFLVRILTQTNSTTFLNIAQGNPQEWFKIMVKQTSQPKSSTLSLNDYRPGSYTGLADVFALRVQIEKSHSLDQLIDITNDIKRTWPVVLGFGTSLRNQSYHASKIDGISSPAVMMTYEDNIRYWRDETFPQITEKPILNNILMVDRRPQPSPLDATLYPLLQQNYGKLSIEWYLQNVPQQHKSGDVHAVWYDHNTNDVYISLGKLNDKWDYEEDGKAFQRPWMKYNWNQLFAEVAPKISSSSVETP